MKKCYSFHSETGVFLGVDFAQQSPLEPMVSLLPAGATFLEPPVPPDGTQCVWNGESWELQDIPQTLEPDPEPAAVSELEPTTWKRIREARNTLLTACDWTQLSDIPLSETQVAAWRQYRQTLRDITETFETPEAVEWPQPPDAEIAAQDQPKHTN
jgi:hypothetical protein